MLAIKNNVLVYTSQKNAGFLLLTTGFIKDLYSRLLTLKFL